MKMAVNTDIALLPVGGTYTTTAEEAADAVNKIILPENLKKEYNSVTIDDLFIKIARPKSNHRS